MNCREEVAAAVDELAQFAIGTEFDDLPGDVIERMEIMLIDLFGVTAAGAHTNELIAIQRAWTPRVGEVRIIGTDKSTDAETAAYLNAIASCALELDEGNKHARGHPAAHVVFAAIAAAQLSGVEISGREFLRAVAIGYEVAARFGRALTLQDGWHTHGHWGATGAACAAGLIWGLQPKELASAIDAATGLIHVTPWETVTGGNFVRNLWVAGANIAGLNACRLATAGVVSNSGNAAVSLGGLVGTLRPHEITRGLETEWLASQGYMKLHSSCSYTHAAVDIILQLKKTHSLTPEEIESIDIRTNSLPRRLFSTVAHNRLSAMFSFPFVAAAALCSGQVDPGTMDPRNPNFGSINAVSRRVRLHIKPEFDSKLPQERWTEVEITLVNGQTIQAAQPNPRGDRDFSPLGREEVRTKLISLIGTFDTTQIVTSVGNISGHHNIVDVLSDL